MYYVLHLIYTFIMTGECGLRGGYMELHNVDQDVIDMIYKMSSINLCSTTETLH